MLLAKFSMTEPTYGLFIWTVIAFLIFCYLFYRFGYGPISDSLDKRNSDIQSALDEAQKAKVELQNLQSENERMLAAAREEQTKILAEAKAAKETIIEEAKVKAKEEADKILASANQEIENQKKAAITEVKNESALVSLAIAENVIKRQLSENADQEGLMDKLIDEIKFN